MKRRYLIPSALLTLALCAAAPSTGPSTRPATPTDAASAPPATSGGATDVAYEAKVPIVCGGGGTRKVVFVCEASGVMVNKMAAVREQLRKAIVGLKPQYSFNVIFYYDGAKIIAADNNALLLAGAENKRKAYAFLDDVEPAGRADPIPALRMAFKQNPDLIYLVGDGVTDDSLPGPKYKEIIEEINRLETAAHYKPKINTILFDADVEAAADVYKKIATDNGGTYRSVKESKP